MNPIENTLFIRVSACISGRLHRQNPARMFHNLTEALQ